jgi:hypothetical protein
MRAFYVNPWVHPVTFTETFEAKPALLIYKPFRVDMALDLQPLPEIETALLCRHLRVTEDGEEVQIYFWDRDLRVTDRCVALALRTLCWRRELTT